MQSNLGVDDVRKCKWFFFVTTSIHSISLAYYLALSAESGMMWRSVLIIMVGEANDEMDDLTRDFTTQSELRETYPSSFSLDN